MMNKSAVKLKSFDAVQTMRDIRERLSQRYWQHIDELKSDLKKVQEKRINRRKKSKPGKMT